MFLKCLKVTIPLFYKIIILLINKYRVISIPMLTINIFVFN